MDLPDRDGITATAVPIHLSETPSVIDDPPSLGEHTDEILSEAGFDEREIEAFRADDVVS